MRNFDLCGASSEESFFDHLDRKVKPLIEPVLIDLHNNSNKTQHCSANQSKVTHRSSRQTSLHRYEAEQISGLVKVHLTHLLLKSSLIKTNSNGANFGKRYCKLTKNQLLVFSSKTNADLNPNKPKTTIDISCIKSVELIPKKQL